MIIDKGFYVDNFVGTYRLEFDEVLDQIIIVSKEYNHPLAGEPELKKKRIFEYDARNDDHIHTNFANVDLSSNSAILDYCNKYGLPYSSQLISDKNQWYGSDVDSRIATAAAQSGTWKYRRNDVTTLRDFSKSVIIVRKLIRLGILANEKQLTNASYTEFISILLFFLFFSHEHYYVYNPREEVLPQERVMRFQYEFQLFRRINRLDNGYSAPKQIAGFLAYIEHLKKNPERIGLHQLQVDLNSKIVERAITLLTPHLYTKSSDSCIIFNSAISYQSYGNFKFERELVCTENQERLEALRLLGIDIFCGIINDGLGFTSPSLFLEDGVLRGGWKLSYQMNGIYMELFLEAAADSQFRQCANPTCGKFFSASRGRPNKRFCCHECAALEAKRRERRRKREGKTT